ncbi:uncharacterized protein LOC120547046 [Perca fluviatilis]|uniref:uncharacterized protein LOC120547046 n=1 Tax=Perca fluviatilis TaxID=8168 RepID=UPI0019653378|nr:uncharacterized protein LOC120547046 [Perca fluviatilis]
MDQIRWIIMSSFLMLLVHFTAARTFFYPIVKVGDDVTLSCDNGMDDQDQCEGVTWYFVNPRNKGLTLFEHGQIQAKSDRLSVTENCSLVIKNIKHDDVGRYDCGHFRSGKLHGEDTVVALYVVTMSEQKDDDDTVTLVCSVSGYSLNCFHTVSWRYGETDVGATRYPCSAVLFTPYHLNLKSEDYELLKCKVTRRDSGNVQLFTFIPPQSSGEKPGDNTTTTISPTTTESASENNNQTKPEGWWRIIVVPLGLTSLITSVVVVNIWTRAKGNKTQTKENIKYDNEDEGTVTYENAAEPSTSV